MKCKEKKAKTKNFNWKSGADKIVMKTKTLPCLYNVFTSRAKTMWTAIFSEGRMHHNARTKKLAYSPPFCKL